MPIKIANNSVTTTVTPNLPTVTTSHPRKSAATIAQFYVRKSNSAWSYINATSNITTSSSGTIYAVDNGVHYVERLRNLGPGDEMMLPDGSIIKLDKLGNYTIEDKDARITYKANRVREFNRYVNASDLLEEFIKFAGEQNVSQEEFMQLPIELFINWLILEAALADGEEPPQQEIKTLETSFKQVNQHRCLCCGRFITKVKAKVTSFCNGDHMDRYLARG